ncbi:thioredoxin family protein [Sulfurimonas sp. HSL-1656]|uniref:thioredoxin family protein n=1 Tax=Thiomicrolovo subterrani TaxID=3131934 RepID=UPI0031F84F35
MKRFFFLLALTAALLSGAEIRWEKDFEAALAKAKTLDRPLFFVFSRHSCKWCRHLEATTFKNAEVIERLNGKFVNVIAYTDDGDNVPRELWSPGTPALWFLEGSGEVMFPAIPGAVGAADFLKATGIVLEAYEERRMQR